MQSIDTVFTPLVVPYCPGVTSPDVRVAVVRATRELCTRAHVWQTLTTYDMTAGDPELGLTVPSGAELECVLRVWLYSTPLRLIATDQVLDAKALRGAIGGDAAQRGTPEAVFFATADQVPVMRLFPVPTESVMDVITVKASFRPTRAATTLDDDVVSRWAEVIAYGALYHLMATPEKPYTSDKAAHYRAEYERGLGRAHNQTATGAVRASQAVQPRRFA